jgi:asparagine synthase (glutamine-hydrolysing)
MCGIVALFSSGGGVREETIERATNALRHRGPDAQHHWVAPDSKVALGHARLSIIDLRTGDQPIANEDGRMRIVANGEFYGFETIRKDLEAGGHRFRTRSDSEIALHLYEDFGTQCLHRLRGEFAFVVWDQTSRTLFAARDRFGIKPLFYASYRGTLYLASEIKALFEAGVPARWDPVSVYNAFDHGGQQARTLFEGVFQVPPGHFLLATDSHLQLVKYWDFDYPRHCGDGPTRSDEDYAAEFREVFEEAVRIRLRADVPVGCYLSGGLDSCSVLGLAARHHAEPIRAFTLCFDHVAYDEEPQAREMAAKVGAQFIPIPIRQDDLADHFADAVAQSEALCNNAHGVAKYLLSRAVRDAGYKVVLTGEGSDEILGGYAHFRRDMLLYNHAGQDPGAVASQLEELGKRNAVSRGLLLPDGDAGPLEGVKRMLGFVPSWIEAWSARSMKVRAVMSDDFLAGIEQREGYLPLFSEIDVRGQLQGREPVHQSLYLWAKTLLPGYILTLLGDRMEMAHSVEGRVPFLDHRVVEVLRSQPVSQKIRGTTEKYVLREAVRDVITDTVYRRQKHPFLTPPSTLNPEKRLNTLVQDTLRGNTIATIPYFDRGKIVDLLDRVDDMDEGARTVIDQVLMLLVSVCVLHDRFHLAS